MKRGARRPGETDDDLIRRWNKEHEESGNQRGRRESELSDSEHWDFVEIWNKHLDDPTPRLLFLELAERFDPPTACELLDGVVHTNWRPLH
jgi:hypothetical protein